MSMHAADVRPGWGYAVGVVGAGLAASVALALSLTGTTAAFLASITNSTNTAGVGALVMQETNADGSVVCTSTDGGGASANTATCATIDKFGGNLSMVPGQTVPVVVTIADTGSIAAKTLTLTPQACTQSPNGAVSGSATDLCARLQLTIVQDGSTVFTGSLATLASGGPLTLTPPAAGASSRFTFETTLDASAGNAYQGLQASEPLTWTFTS